LSQAFRILVVDDELSMRELLEIVLENAGYTTLLADNVEAATEILSKEPVDAVITDLYMGNDREAGMRLVEWISENAAHIPTIMITAHGSVELAVEAIRRGAVDYVQKPFKNDEIKLRVERAIAQRNLQRENEAMRAEQTRRSKLDGMIGQSAAFKKVYDMVRRVANLPSTVALHGESGAGKEVVARSLHQLSKRKDKPFVAINCGGIPETLLESELFGYKKGAFTGATEDKEGLFVVANGGTLFLDEIGDMPLQLQVKLLRVLDNSTVTPVGGTASVKVDVRIISATNRDLEQMAEDGSFRSDLYYRLNVIPIVIPPLRERRDDIPLLVRHFAEVQSKALERDHPQVSAEAMEALVNYHWPGNVRELANCMERAVALCAGSIELSDLPGSVQHYEPPLPKAEAGIDWDAGAIDLEARTAEFEISIIQQALERARYSQKRAAQLLSLSPRSLRYRLQKYGLDNH
jgi:two-component system response regulator PilR (NtrC family)